MAKFCELCPLAQEAHGEIVTLELVGDAPIEAIPNNFGVATAAAVLVDEAGNRSRTLKVPVHPHVSNQEILTWYCQRLEECTNPEMQEKGFFKKKGRIICPALGKRAIEPVKKHGLRRST